jgi:hypothetical protein
MKLLSKVIFKDPMQINIKEQLHQVQVALVTINN